MVTRGPRPPQLGRLRLADHDDVPYIVPLINYSMELNFRFDGENSHITNLIDTSVISICQLDITGAIVGFLSLNDYPLIPGVHPSSWEDYIKTKYHSCIDMQPRNTLFIHMMCWNTDYSREVVDSMLRAIFMHDPYVFYIAMVKPLLKHTLLTPGHARSEASFRRVQAMERGLSPDQLPPIYIADRSEVCPRLRVRRAVEEDNDDIVPIIERHSKRLKEIYGEFYISELISRHPESERVLLVCEHKEVAVGVMCLNTQINYEALEESFELSPFGGLRRLIAKMKHCNLDSDLMAASSISVYSGQFNMSSPSALEANKIVLRMPEPSHSHIDHEIASTRASESGSSSLIGSVYQYTLDAIVAAEMLDWLGEESELEFDIVNIPDELLTIPPLYMDDEDDLMSADVISKALRLDHKKQSLSEDKFVPTEGSGKAPRLRSVVVQSIQEEPETVRYKGPPNAFILELFAMHPDYDERYGFDILEAAYDVFPNRDYCVLCLPSNHPPFPLLEHFTLVTPLGSRLRFINESLYVAHVNSVKGKLSVRAGEAYDLPAIRDILERVPRREALLDLFKSTVESSNYESYVLLSENQPVGMFIVGQLQDTVIIRTQYELEPESRHPCSDGIIVGGVLSPALEPHARWYLRELIRFSEYSTLFWLSKLVARGDSKPHRNLMSFVSRMVPVRMRRAMPNITGDKMLDQILHQAEVHGSSTFALWMIERPITSLPKVDINCSIVVVGSSRTGLAFLEKLFMGDTAKYLTFNNITLVSEHGVPTVPDCLRAADLCVPRDGRYHDRYLKCMPFYYYMDVMSGTMSHIDRKKQCIHLRGGGEKFYDELILTCGLQFQHPDYLKDALRVAKLVQKGAPCTRTLMDDPDYLPDRVPTPPDLPENVMLINSTYEANRSLKKLLRMMADTTTDFDKVSSKNPIVVYGECLEAYTCITALQELKIPSEKITFVEPFPMIQGQMRVNCFNDEIVDDRVQASVEQSGVTIIRKTFISGWRTRGERVSTLRLMSAVQAVNIPCFALFYFGNRAIDLYAFKAINECGLVYDGGLVVGRAFDTNDPHVYAGGSCVRYSLRLHARDKLHKLYHSEDVGEAMATFFLLRTDPFVLNNPNLDNCPSGLFPQYNPSLLTGISQSKITMQEETTLNMKRRWYPVLKFDSPIVQYAVLPGPLYYLKVRPPGEEKPLAVQLSLPRQGHTLVTDKMGNYFRLKLNVLHCVEVVTCLSKKPFSADLLTQIYGKHEAYFNKLLYRYLANQVEDMFEYFKQPWMSVLYQETFEKLLSEISEQEFSTVYDKVRTMFSQSFSTVKSGISLGNFRYDRALDAETTRLTTIRSLIGKFLSASQSLYSVKGIADIPTECGQSALSRGEARMMWTSLAGDRLVMKHLAAYIDKNRATNPHYATTDQDFEYD